MRLSRSHVRNGLWMGGAIALAFIIPNAVHHGVTLRWVLLSLLMLVVFIAGQVWAYWLDDNSSERRLRVLRARRGVTRSKTR